MAPSTEGLMHDRGLYRLTRLALVLSPGHHLDDLIRQNAVGWPLTSEVNAFTASLVYPVIAAGPEAAGNLFRREGETPRSASTLRPRCGRAGTAPTPDPRAPITWAR
jgi:hypothetical protein